MRKVPFLGYGLGLRTKHYEDIISQKPNGVDWFEAITENYMVDGGKPLYYLHKIAEHYPIVFHGVGLGIANANSLDKSYLKSLKKLIDEFKPEWVSDHLCWTGSASHNSHDLLPIIYNKTTLDFVVDKVKQVQDFLGERILLENPSTYIQFKDSNIEEGEFVAMLLERADCLMLLDVNNAYVNSYNHNSSAYDFINSLPSDRIAQIHMAGHTNYGDYVIDTHDNKMIPEVLSLYKYTIEKYGLISTMIEWDDNIPPLNSLLDELSVLKDIANTVASISAKKDSASSPTIAAEAKDEVSK